MSDSETKPSVRDFEKAFLRKYGWWVFPVAGALASLAVGGPFWAWVAGGPVDVEWSRLASLRTWAWAGAFLGIPAAWGLGLRLPARRAWMWTAALVLFISAELLLRTPLAQISLWLAARSRLDAGQHFMREVCYVRLEESVGRDNPAPAVVLVGSSQVLNGVDDRLLRELLAPVPVFRRAMFGMSPLKALAMRAYMPIRPGDRCVMYLSEFDFTNQDEFPQAWFRPYASWQTLPAVLRCVHRTVRIRHWRDVVDYALAATFEWWRDRDFLRQIVHHFRGAGVEADPGGEIRDPAALADMARAELRFSEAEHRAFEEFARRLFQRQAELVVFEGDVNPAIYSPARLKAKAQVRELLAGMEAVGGYRYISREEQGTSFAAEYWFDMSHLNARGREKLTRRMAEVLSDW